MSAPSARSFWSTALFRTSGSDTDAGRAPSTWAAVRAWPAESTQYEADSDSWAVSAAWLISPDRSCS